jgi:hypothetical protein
LDIFYPVYFGFAAILKWMKGKKTHQKSGGVSGIRPEAAGLKVRLDRIGEAESVAASGRIPSGLWPHRTPDTVFRRLFSFQRGLNLELLFKQSFR